MDNDGRKNILLLIDILCMVTAYAFSLFIRFRIIGEHFYYLEYHLLIGTYLVVLCLLYNIFIAENEDFFVRGWDREFYFALRYSVSIVVGLSVVIYFTQQSYEFSRLIYFIFALSNTVITYLAHMLYKNIVWKHYRNGTYAEQLLIITTSDLVDDVLEKFSDKTEWYYNIAGLVIYDTDMSGRSIGGVPVIAGLDSLYGNVIQMAVDEVFICLPGVSVDDIREMVGRFEEMGLICHYNVDLFMDDSYNTSVRRMAGYNVVSFDMKAIDSRKLVVKRLIDIVGALVGLVITAVITPFVAVAIKVDSRGPVFFSQTRIGKNGRRFRIWKFRSMYMDAEERKKELESQNEVKGLMFKMENDPRITKVGHFIRRTSIDETPQFLNILVGDMSLVGTRPPTEDEFEQYNGYYRRRMSITPGLTGMWQVSGRSDIQDFDEIVKLDLEYIDNWSIWLDIKILFKTVWAVIGRRGSK
jgi:exopolysaccharide biosynthesis polyprenyl glycosylphosphotransferase